MGERSSPWPGYASGLTGCIINNYKTTLKCENGVIVNSTTSDGLVPTQEGIKHAKKVGYLED